MKTLLERLAECKFSLAADRSQNTVEPHFPNDYYGHAEVLKAYVGMSLSERLPVSIMHGIRFSGETWAHDFWRLHRIGFVFSPLHAKQMTPKVRQTLVPVGPMILYAQGFWDNSEMEEVRKRYGRILLVYPTHSTHWVDALYNIEEFCKHIEQHATSYDTVIVCLYWKDILRGMYRSYEEKGWLCVTNGHMYDTSFMRRQRSLLEASSAVLTNWVGTHVGYSVALNKPVRVLPLKCWHTSNEGQRIDRGDLNKIVSGEIADAFSGKIDSITPRQRELVNLQWGLDSHKSRTEMGQLIFQADASRRAEFPLVDLREDFQVGRREFWRRIRERKLRS
jgi:hypothetical protein